MPPSIVTSQGQPLLLGREVGAGGEGAVFALPRLPGRVAKLYHRRPTPDKQAKLRFMSAIADATLLRYAAWPQQTLHASPGGPVVGFLMQEIAGRDSIHAVYSPLDRRELRPKAAWDFLLHVARNAAAAFAALHARGHVVGDVNQGNLVVGGDSTVILIDCDSFQVDATGTLHLCEVGVSHFTPPELQGVTSFDGLVRTANHDNFGLALLIFHLLLGGRHPYSGVPLHAGVGDSLEADIRAFRYAYAADAARRGLTPPPGAIPTSMLPHAIQQMFRCAFTQAGAHGQRPTAARWMQALDDLRDHLASCRATPLHVYPDHLLRCPWCALEQHGVVYFIDGDSCRGIDLARAWARIEAVRAPAPIVPVHASPHAMRPAPLPASVRPPGAVRRYRLLVVLMVILLVALVPRGWPFALMAGGLAWQLAASLADEPRRRERARRRAALLSAQHDYERLLAAVRQEAGPEGFAARRMQLARLRDECRRLREEETQARAGARGTGLQRPPQAAQRARFAARRGPREAALARGAVELQRFSAAAPARVAARRAQLEAAAHRVAQAQCDISLFG
jgi:DNA-binding helix-hairpin-helix protein with protein kinase domain